MKKKFILLISVFLLFLTGCSKEVITTDTFMKQAEENNLEVSDAKEQYANYDSIKEVMTAGKGEWKVEFYVLDSVEAAKGMFDTNYDLFQAQKEKSFIETSSNEGNYDLYSLTCNGKYMYICRVSNTLIYASVDDGYKRSVKKFIKSLGY